MKKVVPWSVGAILIAGLAAGLFWWRGRPQAITFSDGSRVTYLGADYGTLHIPPTIKAPGLVAHPELVQRSGSSFTTSNDTLVVWVRQEFDPGQWRSFHYYLCDKARTARREVSGMNYDIRRQPYNRVVGLSFNDLPPNQRKFLLVVQENGNGGQETADREFVIRNPARGMEN